LKTLEPTPDEHIINGALLDYLRHIDPLPRGVRRFQKQRDAMIDALSAGGEVAGHERIAQALGVSLRKYVTLSRMIAASEPISIHESAIASEVTG
jgi:DNA-directed RNA polymerase specialized sigma subunit